MGGDPCIGSPHPFIPDAARKKHCNMPTTTSRGYQLNYIVAGDGPTLVLIPGLTQSLHRWVERGYVEHFAHLFRVIAVDPLGHGASDKPHTADAYQMADCALDVLAVLDAEGVREAHV